MIKNSKMEKVEELINKYFHRYPYICTILFLPMLSLLPFIFLYASLISIFDDVKRE